VFNGGCGDSLMFSCCWQTQSLSVEYENLKKALSSHEVAKEIEETEKRLKHLERYKSLVTRTLLMLKLCRSIFELREFVETKTRETDFEVVKESCFKVAIMLQNIHCPTVLYFG
jgi:protein subunit release factor A